MQTLTDATQLNTPAVVLKIGAKWCAPCRQIAPVLAALENELPWVNFYEADSDDQPELVQPYNPMGLPTLVILRQGQEVGRTVGVSPKAKLLDTISRALQSA